MARKPVEEGEIEATTATLKRVERDNAMALAPLEFEADRQLAQKATQEHREQQIRICHEGIGRIQAATIFKKLATVAEIVWFREQKESKVYHDDPAIKTWENFCNYCQRDRRTVDEDIQNLGVFGEEFLETCRQFSIGYRDLRKLRQLTHEGSVIIDAETIKIGDKTIPFDQDHAEDLQAAIEWIIDDKAGLVQRVERLEKDMNGIVKEETKSLEIERDLALKEVKRLKVFDPLDKDREWSIEMMAAVYKAAVALEVTIQKFVIDPRMDGDRHLQAQVWAHLNASTTQLEDLDKRMRDAFYSDED